MKRSDAIRAIKKHLERDYCYACQVLSEDNAEEILNLMEGMGMTPPTHLRFLTKKEVDHFNSSIKGEMTVPWTEDDSFSEFTWEEEDEEK